VEAVEHAKVWRVQAHEIDAVVWRRVGEHARDQMHVIGHWSGAGVRRQLECGIRRGVARAVEAQVLEVAAADEAAHGVRDQVDAKLPAIGGVRAADVPPHAQDESPQVRRNFWNRLPPAGAEILRRLFVIAEDPDRSRRAFLALVDLGAVPKRVGVPLVFHQPHERRLEDEAHDRAVVALPDLRRAVVEAHVGARGRVFDLAHGGGETADVDDREIGRLNGHGEPRV
jgi:hypothetical protein